MTEPVTVLRDERQQRILLRLGEERRIIAVDLAREFSTSEDTIRRDLRELAAAGFCRRVYGGALPLSPASGTHLEREEENPGGKEALGQAVARLVGLVLRPGQVLFIDAGSTTLAAARALPVGLNLTVVTNSPYVATALLRVSGIETVMIGGPINRRVGAALGGRAIRDAHELRADLAILGACAVDATAGIGAFDSDDAEFKRAICHNSAATAVAVTSDKLNTRAPFAVVPMKTITHLIVEADAPKAPVRKISALGVQVIDAHADPRRPS